MSKKFDLDDVVYLLSALLPSVTRAALAAMQGASETRNTHIEEPNVYKGSVGQDPRKAGAYGYQTEGDIIRKPYPVDEGLEAAKEFVSNMGGNHTDAHEQFLADMDTDGEFVCAKHLADAVSKRSDGSWTVAVVVKGAGARRLQDREGL